MTRYRKKHAGRPSRKAAPALPPLDVTPDRLGAQGDAVAAGPDGPLYIPYALPGDRLRVRPGERRGDGRVAVIEEILTPAPERVPPPCPHFGTCGGCVVQHLAPQAEAVWKRDTIVAALRQRGFDAPPVEETVSLPPGIRRRAVLGYRQTAKAFLLGFNARQSHQLIDLQSCPVLRPEIAAVLPDLRAALASIVPQGAGGTLMIVLAANGLDVALDLPESPDLGAREALAAMAEALDLARLVLYVNDMPEPVAIRRQPTLPLGEASVALPSRAFLQPSEEGETALVDLVRAGLAGVSGRVADLFCGLGTFALPLARDHKVVALDADAALVGALAATNRLQAQVRDLFRRPLMEGELKGLAAVVLDPPRAGARAQVEALAMDGPARIVMVSCNPATFARDARILADGGYLLDRVTPVDQFAWSPHVELVAVFSRRE